VKGCLKEGMRVVGRLLLIVAVLEVLACLEVRELGPSQNTTSVNIAQPGCNP
jgi:hypothetical protein